VARSGRIAAVGATVHVVMWLRRLGSNLIEEEVFRISNMECLDSHHERTHSPKSDCLPTSTSNRGVQRETENAIPAPLAIRSWALDRARSTRRSSPFPSPGH